MKIAICGVWHVHAPQYLKIAREHGEIVGVWEADEKRRADFCAEFGTKEFKTFEELLASDAEAVIVCSSTDTHAELMLELAKAKKDIFTEKVITLTDEDAEAVAKAIEENGVRFCISLIWKYNGGAIAVKKTADSGELGKINYIRMRNCHSGSTQGWLPAHFYNEKECGGGAMIDLGAHGMYLTEWIGGMPIAYSSAFTNSCSLKAAQDINPDGVEDNAVTLMTFANGCIAINETGFVSNHYPLSFEVGGEKGYVRWVMGEGVKKCTDATEGKTVDVEVEPDLPSPLVQFLTNKQLDGCGIEDALKLTHMMVEAYN